MASELTKANVTVLTAFNNTLTLLDLNDPVEGGLDGIDNKPHIELFQNQIYLNDVIEELIKRVDELEKNPVTPTPTSWEITANNSEPLPDSSTTFTITTDSGFNGSGVISVYQDSSGVSSTLPVPIEYTVSFSSGIATFSHTPNWSTDDFEKLSVSLEISDTKVVTKWFTY